MRRSLDDWFDSPILLPYSRPATMTKKLSTSVGQNSGFGGVGPAIAAFERWSRDAVHVSGAESSPVLEAGGGGGYWTCNEREGWGLLY